MTGKPGTLLPLQLSKSKPVSGSTVTSVVIGVVVVAALYFGREVLVPIALAILLSFVLSPLVGILRSWYFPRALAVLLVVFFAFVAIFALGTLMVSQVNELASDLPRYQYTLQEKIDTLRGGFSGGGTLERASEVLQDLKKEIEKPKAEQTSPPIGQPALPSKPLPVEVIQPDPGALQTLAALIAPLIHPLTTTGIVVIFVIFILLQQHDLRNRLVRLAGAGDLQRTTAALDDAGERLSRLFLTQLGLNAAFGVVIGVGLWIIGVPSAPLWGMLAMVLRFVPYIGGVISAIFPLVLAAAVGVGWTMVLWTAALFLIVEPILGQVIEPLAFGHRTGLSPVSVVVSATFWTWLWGPIGLILATPLTICMVVLGRHVDRLKFLEVMFGNQPPLTPAELIYQRMLARDPVEATEQAETFLRENPLVAYYDEILFDGLRLAQADAARGLLDDERMRHIRDAVAEIVDDLKAHEDKAEAVLRDDAEQLGDSPLAHLQQVEATHDLKSVPEGSRVEKPVLCIPGLSLLDEATAMVVAQLVERHGIGARAEQADALSMSRMFSWDIEGVALVCLCYVEDPTSAQVRYAVRRIRRRLPNVNIVIALFGDPKEVDGQELPSNTEFVERSLRATVDKIVAIASSTSDKQGPPKLSVVTTGRELPGPQQGTA
jgi:predicted PurR-regulated permease PerM